MKDKIERVLRLEPELKAKEIAKKLGVDRSDVNSLLYKYPETFRMDSGYCWSLIEPEKIVIEFASNIWVTAADFEAYLSQVGSPLDSEIQSVTFCIPKGCKILLEASARLLALANQLNHAEKNVTIDFSKCVNTRSYFDRMGFFDSLHNTVVVLPSRPSGSRAKRFRGNNLNVVEFGIVAPASTCADDLTQQDKVLVNQLTDSFIASTDERYEGVANAIFSELIGNIKGHSETPIAGFAAFQRYSGNPPHIQTVVSDSGVGIATTLKRSLGVNYPDIYRRMTNSANFDAALVVEVLTKGQISRHGKARGLGFKTTSKKVINFNAKLSARQENFCVEVSYRDGALVDIQVFNDLATIKGTHICFDFQVDYSASSD